MKKNWKKYLKKTVGILFTAGAVGVLSLLALNQYVKHTSGSKILTSEQIAQMGTEEVSAALWPDSETGKADCILILGAGVWDGSPSPMLQDRLDTGLTLYQAGAAEKILVSGDHGREAYDEVNVMKEYLVEAGVPAEDIFMDHAGFSTYESMYRAKDVFQVQSMLVVTQEYHLYRSLYVAEQLGMEAYGVGADPRQYAGQVVRECREVLARAKDVLYVSCNKQPTYLGAQIDIHGDGNITNH